MLDIEKVNITPELLMDISEIEEFKGKFSLYRNSYSLSLFKTQARITGTAASIRIEGSILKDYEVERVLGGLSSSLYRDSDINDAINYASAVDYINDYYEVLPLSEYQIKKLHSIIISASDDYRKSDKPRQNIEYDEPDVFNATSKDAPLLMSELVEETQTLLRNRAHHPLIITALFIVRFLSINPFEEGNGRLSRILISYLLQRSGYSFIAYYPFESIIEETRKSYMNTLKRTQLTFESGPDYSIWLNYFIKTILKAAKRLESKLERDSSPDDVRPALSPIEQDIERILIQKGELYTSLILDNLAEYKVPTLKKALSMMVKKGVIEQLGSGRGTYYRIK